MNHLSQTKFLDNATPMPLKGRALAKVRTREKVLEAARLLFIEHGYEAATIRGIAAAAGMSTGAVFASFADKAELFDEILITDFETIRSAMLRALAAKGATADRLIGMFEVAYGYYMAQLPLVRTGVAVSWTRGAVAEQRNLAALQPILAMMTGALKAAADEGELSKAAPFETMTAMIWDLYLAGYRHAINDGKTTEDLTSRLRVGIELILAGARA